MKKYTRKPDKYDTWATHRNTPHLKENLLTICLCYGFSAINLIGAGIYGVCTADRSFVQFIILGVVMLGMVPLSWFDRRKDMCGMVAVIVTCILHLVFCLMIAAFLSWWLMLLYPVEVALFAVIVYIAY